MPSKRSTSSDKAVTPASAAAPARRRSTTAKHSTKKTLPVDAPKSEAAEQETVITPAAGKSSGTKAPRRPKVAAAAAGTTSVNPPGMGPEIEISHDEVALQAYYYWQERGCEGDRSEEDWHRAAQEIRRRKLAASTANA